MGWLVRQIGHPQVVGETILIGPMLFAILVIMAIVTTLMASPVFEWVYRRHSRKPITPLPDVIDA